MPGPTPVTLPNGTPMKERIGVFGLPKIGKTHLYFTIAKWHHDLGSDAMFYGINTDMAWEIVYSNPEFMNLSNIQWEDCDTFQKMMNAARKYNEILRPQDWLSVDLLDNGWDFVQDEYARMRAKESDENLDFDNLGDLWVTSGSTSKYPIEGWDWATPNARYRRFANNYILRGNGHRFLISGQAEVMQPSANMKENEEARNLRKMFEHLGVKPTGQKGDAFRWHTLLNVVSMGEKQQGLATAGERSGRRRWMGKKMKNGHVTAEPISDFFLDYLVEVAGWSMGD